MRIPRPLAILTAFVLVATSCSRAARKDAPEAEAPKTDSVAVTGSRDASPLTQGAAVAGPFDARFIDAMIPHHEMGVAMAQEAIEKAERPEIRSLAQDIVKTQSEEIDTLRTWREAWYPGLMPTGSGAMAQLEGAGKAEPVPAPAHDPAATREAGATEASSARPDAAAHETAAHEASAHEMAASMPAGSADRAAPGATGAASASPADAGTSSAHAASTLTGAEFDRDFLERMIPHHLQAVDMAQRAQAQAEHQELRELAAKMAQQQQAEIALMRQWRAEPAAQVSRTEED